MGSIGTGSELSITAGGTVILDDALDDILHWTYVDTSGEKPVTHAVAVFSAGAFIKKNDNTLILDSALLHGTTKIEGGTLQLGNGEDTIGSASMGAVGSNGTFEISKDARLVIDYDIRENVDYYNAGNFVILGPVTADNIKEENPTISGDGELIKNGSRTLILTGYIAHIGGTTVNEGNLNSAIASRAPQRRGGSTSKAARACAPAAPPSRFSTPVPSRETAIWWRITASIWPMATTTA